MTDLEKLVELKKLQHEAYEIWEKAIEEASPDKPASAEHARACVLRDLAERKWNAAHNAYHAALRGYSELDEWDAVIAKMAAK